MTYEQRAEAIAIAIWEASTGNGRDLNLDMWDEHMQNCQNAASNAYHDGISDADWHVRALARVA